MKKVLITTIPFGNPQPKPLEMLKNAGIEYTINPFKRKITDLEYWLRLLRVALGVGESLVNPSLFVDEAIDCLFRLSKVLAIFLKLK